MADIQPPFDASQLPDFDAVWSGFDPLFLAATDSFTDPNSLNRQSRGIPNAADLHTSDASAHSQQTAPTAVRQNSITRICV